MNSPAESNEPRPSTPPPAIERNRSRIVIVIAASLTIVAMLLVILVSLDSTPEDENEIAGPIGDPPIELVPRNPRGGEGQDLSDIPFAEAGKGGWVQVADPDDPNRVAQRYTFASLDPNPPNRTEGWVQMDKPRAQLYLSDDRVVTLAGDKSFVHRPNRRTLEYGSMEGNVIIELYETTDRRPVNPDVDQPILRIETPEAEFDSFNNEIVCAGDVNISSPQIDMPGRRLLLQINDRDDFIQLLRIDEVDYLKVTQLPSEEIPAQARAPRQRDVRLAAFSQQDRARNQRQRDRGRDNQPSTPAPSADDAQYYRLTLDRNISIRRGPTEARQVVSGDTLHAVFSTQSKGITDGLASTFVDPLRSTPAASSQWAHAPVDDMTPMSFEAWVARASLGTLQDDRVVIPEPSAVDTVVTFDGPLEVRPITTIGPDLPTPDDTRVSVFGTPVTLDDPVESIHAAGDELRYSALDKRIDLLAAERDGVVINTDQLGGTGEHFWISSGLGRGGFLGPGMLVGQDTPALDEAQDESSSQESTTDDPPADDASDDQLVEDMRINWEGGVDLRFRESANEDELGDLERIIFNGDVAVVSTDGTIDCQSLEMQVKTNEAGELEPDRMIASGDIKTSDTDRTMWADSLIVTFLPALEDDAASDEDQGAELGSSGLAKKARLRTLLATGDVQVLLNDGSRAFAERLYADGESETAELTGENVIVVSGQLLIDRGQKIVLDKTANTATAPGPGQARIFNKPLPTLKDGRMERPDVKPITTEKPMVRARWNESMVYDHTRNEGAGSVDLRGQVNAEATPNPLERNTMTGESLTLDFRMKPTVEVPGIEETPAPDADDNPMARGDRELLKFTARGDAKIENRTWIDEAHSGLPRVFYIAGDFVEYNDQTFESRVIGEGEFLIRDLEKPDAPDEDAEGAAPFTGKGVSNFRWTRQLTVTQRADGQFDILMRGDVDGVHQGLDEKISRITGQTIEAIASRRVPPESDGSTDAAPPAMGMDLGGSMTLRRIRGQGAMLIEAHNRKVTCDSFDYDVDRALATASAQPGRMVRAVTGDDPRSIQAQSILWNLDPRFESIQIRNISGGG